MGIRSLLRKVFGRSTEPVPETSDATSPAFPSQAERTPLDAAADLVAASFDNPTVPPQSAPRDREQGTLLTATTPDPTVPEARRPSASAVQQNPAASPAGPAETPEAPVAEPVTAETPAPEAEPAAAEAVPQAEAAVEAAPEAEPVTAEAAAPAPEAEAAATAAPEPAAEPEPLAVSAEAEPEPVAAQAEPETPAAEATAPEALEAAQTALQAQDEATAPEADTTVTPAPEPEAEPEPEPVAAAAEPAAAEPVAAEPVAAPVAAVPEPVAAQPEPVAVPEPVAEPVTAPEPVAARAEPAAQDEVPDAAAATVPGLAGSAHAAAAVRRRAPGVAGAYKAAAQVLRGKGRAGARAKVYLVLDRSGSMRPFYKDGSTQHLADHALALAAHLDDEATVHTVFFSTEVDGAADLTLDGHRASWVEARHAALGRMGRTNYHVAVEAVVEHYQKAGGEGPALVLFQVDGAPDNRQPARLALAEAAVTVPGVHWQFVAFGEHESKAFDFVRKLDAANAGFFHAGPAPADVPSATLLKGLLNRF